MTRLQRWPILRPYLSLVLRLVLAGAWLYAGVAKVGDPGQFLVGVRAYQVLPDWLARAVAYGLPVLEIGLGLLLLLGLTTRLAAAVSAVVMLVFLAGMISAAARGLSIDCGCFGQGGSVAAGHTRYTQEILRDCALLIAAALLTWWPASRWSADERLAAGAPPVVRPSGRTAAARARAGKLAAAQRSAARRRGQVITAAVAAVLVAAAGIGIAAQAHRNRLPALAVTYTGPVAAASSAGIVVGYPDAPVTVDLYEDFMCPVCGLFETRSGAQVLQLAADHKAKLAYHILNFLDGSSNGTQYSTRAANAAACAADQGVPFVKLHELLYAHQPEENSPGLTDAALIDYGVQAGAPRAAFTTCVQTRPHAPWTAQLTQTAFTTDHVQGTPTIRTAGHDIDWQTPQALINAVTQQLPH